MRGDLEDRLRSALEHADFSRRLTDTIVDVVTDALDCRGCEGSGRRPDLHPDAVCPACHGSGLGGRK